MDRLGAFLFDLSRMPAVAILMPDMNRQVPFSQDDQLAIEVTEDGVLEVDYLALDTGKAHIDIEDPATEGNASILGDLGRGILKIGNPGEWIQVL